MSCSSRLSQLNPSGSTARLSGSDLEQKPNCRDGVTKGVSAQTSVTLDQTIRALLPFAF